MDNITHPDIHVIDRQITQSQLIEKLRDKISDLQDKLIDTLMKLRLTEAENFELKEKLKEKNFFSLDITKMSNLTTEESAGYNKSPIDIVKRQEEEEIINCSKCGKKELTPDDRYRIEETITPDDRFKAVLCYKCFKEEVDMLSEKQDRENQISKFTSKESQDNCFKEQEENRKFIEKCLEEEKKEEAGEEAKDIITCANIPTLTCQKCNKKMVYIESHISTEDFKYKIGSITGNLKMKCPECNYTCNLVINENHINMIIKEYYKDGGKAIKEGSDPVYLQD